MQMEQSFRLNERVTLFVTHLLVAMMMMCLAASVIQFAHRLAPDWRGEFLLLVALLVSLEAMYTTRTTRRVSDLLTSELTYRLIEIVVLLILIKGIMYAFQGFDRLFADLPKWNENFFEAFFTGEYVFVILVSFIIWLLSGWFANALSMLEGDEFLLRSPMLDGLISDRAATKQSLAAGVFGLGFFLVLLTALVQMDMQVIWGNRPLPRWGVLNVILYFIISIALLSMSQFSSRRASWAWERIPISHKLARNWVLYSLVLMVVVAALAFILPTRYTLGFLATLGYVFNIFASVVYFLVFMLTMPFIYLIGLLFSGMRSSEVEEPVEPPTLTMPEFLQQPGTPIPWLEVLRSILFWVFLIAVVGYAFYQYTRQNQELLKKLRNLPGWGWLSGFLNGVIARLRGWNRQVGSAVQARVRQIFGGRPGTEPVLRGQFINLRRLSSRQKVLFYYLALLKRGSEAGVARRPSQTPLEYARSLKSSLNMEDESQPVEEELQSLTDAFMEARYSSHDISNEWAEQVRRFWNHLRQVLRRKTKSGG